MYDCTYYMQNPLLSFCNLKKFHCFLATVHQLIKVCIGRRRGIDGREDGRLHSYLAVRAILITRWCRTRTVSLKLLPDWLGRSSTRPRATSTHLQSLQSFIGKTMASSSSAEAARAHVERIRRERFYIGRGERNPLAEDIHQAVGYLSEELYSKDVHFLMELIQVRAHIPHLYIFHYIDHSVIILYDPRPVTFTSL